jgi:rSAM/selenodomain-associated transferase 1
MIGPGRVLVFARAPVPGEVKTRLVPALGERGAAALHERLVSAALAAACEAAPGAVELWCAPDCRHPFFAGCAARFGVLLRQQCPGDLGDRMAAAFRQSLAQAGRVLLLGSDLPCIDAACLRGAFDALAKADAVFAPAEDGGYGLVGLAREVPDLFTGISWGSGRVMAETRERLRQSSVVWRETEPVWDVDRPEDLARLAQVRLP